MSARELHPTLRLIETLDHPQAGDDHATTQPTCRMVTEDVVLIARVLRLTPRQLSAELPGQSVAQLARAHGVPPSNVLDALLARCWRRVAATLDSGRISAECALDAYPRLAHRAAWRVFRHWER